MELNEQQKTEELAAIAAETLRYEVETTVLQRQLLDIRLNNWQLRRQLTIGSINTQAAGHVASQLSFWVQADESREVKQPIYVNLFNCGLADRASWYDVFAIVDLIQWAQMKGHKVIGQATSFVTIHGLIILQACDERIVAPDTLAILGKIEFGEVRANVKEGKALLKHRERIVSMAQGILFKKSQLKKETLTAHTRDIKSWHLYPDEIVIEFKLADRVDFMLAEKIPAERLYIPAADPIVRLHQAKAHQDEVRSAISEAQRELMVTGTPSVMFFGDVCPESVQPLEHALQTVHRAGKREINIFVYTRGGSVQCGLAIYALAQKLKGQVQLNIYGVGLAASMGGILMRMQIGHAMMGEHSFFMIHPPSNSIGGSTEDMTSDQIQTLRCEDRLTDVLSSGSGYAKEELMALEDEIWLLGKEATDKQLVNGWF